SRSQKSSSLSVNYGMNWRIILTHFRREKITSNCSVSGWSITANTRKMSAPGRREATDSCFSMSCRVELLSGADADLQDIFNRLEDYREGFGVEFMLAVDAYLTRIA